MAQGAEEGVALEIASQIGEEDHQGAEAVVVLVAHVAEEDLEGACETVALCVGRPEIPGDHLATPHEEGDLPCVTRATLGDHPCGTHEAHLVDAHSAHQSETREDHP